MQKFDSCALETYKDQNRILWQVERPYLSLVASQNILELCDQGNIIKTSSARRVLEVRAEGRKYIVKIYYAPLWIDRIHNFLYPRNMQEWKNLRRVAALGIPVPETIGVGKGPDGVLYLITKKIENGKTLKEVVQSPLSWEKRRKIISDLAEMAAKLHNHRFCHEDFHSGNLFLCDDGTLYLLDLYDIHHKLFCRRSIFFRNLAMLGGSFIHVATPPDYIAFFREYCEKSEACAGVSYRSYLREMNDRLWAHAKKFWTQKARKCIKNNKYFKKIKTILGHGFARQESVACATALLSLPPAPQESILKNSRSTFVVKTPFGIWKQYRRKKKINLLLDCFRKSRAQRAWIAGNHCILRGIPTAKPILFMEKRRLGFLASAALLTQEIPHAQTLTQYLESCSQESKRNILHKLGRFVRTLHMRGLAHRDLKGNNWLITPDEKIYLIDLDGLQVKNHLTERRRKKNLARILRSLQSSPQIVPSDLTLFLESYSPFTNRREQF